MLGLQIDQPRRQEHNMLRIRISIVFRHLTPLILMHTPDVSKRAGHDHFRAIPIYNINVTVYILSHDLGLAAHRTIDRKLGTNQDVMAHKLRRDHFNLAMFALLQPQRAL